MVTTRWLALGGLSCLFSFPITAQAQQKAMIYRTVSTGMVEKILQDAKISFQKKTGKKEAGTFYDFTLRKYKIRLHNYEGKELWLSCWFTDPLTIAQVNEWNIEAKFSRAVLIPLANQDVVSLECLLNCRHGVTEGMIRQWLQRFEEDLGKFQARFRGG